MSALLTDSGIDSGIAAQLGAQLLCTEAAALGCNDEMARRATCQHVSTDRTPGAFFSKHHTLPISKLALVQQIHMKPVLSGMWAVDELATLPVGKHKSGCARVLSGLRSTPANTNEHSNNLQVAVKGGHAHCSEVLAVLQADSGKAQRVTKCT